MSNIRITSVVLVIALVSCREDLQTPAPSFKKLEYYTEAFIQRGSLESQTRISFVYDTNGKLEKYTVHTFDINDHVFVQERQYLFSYVDDKVDKITTYLPDNENVYISYEYQYSTDGNVDVITEHNYHLETTSVAHFDYTATDFISVAYSFSNGNSFEYNFAFDKNITSDKVLSGTSECSTGVYSYDTMVNPLHTLGYVDFFLFNLSVNNKLYENVNYSACAFPTLRPETHVYEYDEDGYPTSVVTTYESSSIVSHNEYFYSQSIPSN